MRGYVGAQFGTMTDYHIFICMSSAKCWQDIAEIHAVDVAMHL